MNEVDLLEQRVNELIEEIKQLKEKQAEKKELLRWRANEDEKYWCIVESGNVAEYTENGHIVDNFNYSKGNYFKSKEEAEQLLKNLITKQKLKDLALELNKGKEIDWGNPDQLKYGIVYDFYNNKLDVLNTWSSYSTGEVYCLRSDFLEIAKERIGVTDLIYLIKSGV